MSQATLDPKLGTDYSRTKFWPEIFFCIYRPTLRLRLRDAGLKQKVHEIHHGDNNIKYRIKHRFHVTTFPLSFADENTVGCLEKPC